MGQYRGVSITVAMTVVGQNRKSSLRAYVFRFAPESRHYATHSACPFRARSSAHVAKAILWELAANGFKIVNDGA